MMFLARVCCSGGVGDKYFGHADIWSLSLAPKQQEKMEADFEKGKRYLASPQVLSWCSAQAREVTIF